MRQRTLLKTGGDSHRLPGDDFYWLAELLVHIGIVPLSAAGRPENR
jgi:hypothetical protein